ncbi:hypothetical protein RLEG12_09545 (plasmid) [Rhizobium leguminosarum bv. trifolii CB782]|nr:hypothetical protein RLEG12_09545 [Rhizobium leguminosarum bv. trifolii CB782]
MFLWFLGQPSPIAMRKADIMCVCVWLPAPQSKSAAGDEKNHCIEWR